MEWVFAIAGMAGGFWLSFRVAELCERRYRLDPPDWVAHAIGVPLFLTFLCGAGYLG